MKIVPQCKVCNSQFKTMIENMHTKGMSPQKIYDYLQSLSGDDHDIVLREDIKPSAIRRHMDRHFNVKDEVVIKTVSKQTQIEKTRDSYRQGVAIVVDKVNTVSYLIESALLKFEEVDLLPKDKDRHQYYIQYMNTIRGLIESLAKLTGDLKQDGTIDVNFFSNEIERFAEIVLLTLRMVDKQLGLKGQLELTFAVEFKKQWDAYKLRQEKLIRGELPISEIKECTVNNFNDMM